MPADTIETEATNNSIKNSLDTEAVLAVADEGYEAVKECLDAAEQALNEGSKEEYDQKVQEANAAWELFTSELNVHLSSGSEVREQVLNYCGDLSLMLDGEISAMDDRWSEAGQSAPAQEQVWHPLDAETIRKNFAAAKIKLESLKGIKKFLTLGSSSDRVDKELADAENNYQKAHAEYLGANIEKFLGEKIQFTEAELNSY
jgi:hypothetical protein